MFLLRSILVSFSIFNQKCLEHPAPLLYFVSCGPQHPKLAIKSGTDYTEKTVRRFSRQVSYKVTVYTGGDKGSGTDADVAVTFAGERGESGPHKLLGTGDLFERGQVDDFSIETNDVGDLKTLRVELLAAGTSEWACLFWKSTLF